MQRDLYYYVDYKFRFFKFRSWPYICGYDRCHNKRYFIKWIEGNTSTRLSYNIAVAEVSCDYIDTKTGKNTVQTTKQYYISRIKLARSFSNLYDLSKFTNKLSIILDKERVSQPAGLDSDIADTFDARHSNLL